MIRLCPACQRRWAGLCPTDCPICAGTGVLTLGAASVARLGPEVAALAVEIALESAARRALAQAPADREAARADLADAVEQLRSVRMLAKTNEPPLNRPGGTQIRVARTETIRARARQAAPRYEPGDDIDLDAPRLDFAADDRPLAAGGIPGFSAGGYLCGIARVADPLDPLHVQRGSTREQAMDRWRQQRRAETAAGVVLTEPGPALDSRGR